MSGRYKTVRNVGADSIEVRPDEVKGFLNDPSIMTMLPKSRPAGGVEGMDSPFGNIVSGRLRKWVPNKDNPNTGTYEDISEFGMQKDLKDLAPKVELNADQQELDTTLENLLKEGNISKESVHIQDTAKLVKKHKDIKVTLKGVFGTYQGIYVDTIEQDAFVYLCYDLDSAIFTPPVNITDDEEQDMKNNKVTISWKGKSKECVYSGITVPLKRYGIGIQIYAELQ